MFEKLILLKSIFMPSIKKMENTAKMPCVSQKRAPSKIKVTTAKGRSQKTSFQNP